MNIQIFGTNKCFDTKKAMRYFKEYIANLAVHINAQPFLYPYLRQKT